MLDTETKRRIDTCRDILVGKIPDPKSQVEQITIALIYKFMDDMDADAEELGGRRSFFAGIYSKYGWARLMSPTLGGFEVLALYSEAIQKMNENPGIPPLFRDIFKNAYLPYRDPETLRAFLKEIDGFTYDHSERLGDAFEYLLSVLGSQGDAGQFRTPRHIIDFMVEVIDPQKHESLLDPACGTAGFLISAWKHILRNNTAERSGDKLSPDERQRLVANIHGYDISPDMVRLSLVNLYLHGFADPHIVEYDTLTSDEKWNETADVILANPPFMSPKGGIKPHKRFSIQAKRSEVLFVDYIAEHLSPTGRAAIIVPEGIIFQSQTAYRQLRELLLKTALVAVVSLPAGCFNPYSGVKTSILILDKASARRSQHVAFFKVDNDGYSLGAQRRVIERNDLPQVKAGLAAWLHTLRCGQPVDEFKAEGGLIVAKEKIAANGEFNLSGERYREDSTKAAHFPFVQLGEIADIVAGQSPPGNSYNERAEGAPFYQGKAEFGEIFIGAPTTWTTDPQRFAETGDILMSVRAPVGPVNLATQKICIGRGLAAIRPAEDKLCSSYLFYFLRSQKESIKGDSGATFASINRKQLAELRIPLPPLELQKEIVAEIESYQKVIDGARAVIDHYRPHIPIHPDWPIVEIGAISTIVRGSSPRPQGNPDYFGGSIPRLMVADITRDGMYVTPRIDSLTELGATKSRPMKAGEVVITVSGNPGLPTILAVDACIHDGFVGLRELSSDVLPEYLYFALLALHSKHSSQSVGAVFKNLTTDQIREFKISLPPLATQQAIVAEIEAEQALVAANRELIARFEKKIQATLARVWGDDDSLAPGLIQVSAEAHAAFLARCEQPGAPNERLRKMLQTPAPWDEK